MAFSQSHVSGSRDKAAFLRQTQDSLNPFHQAQACFLPMELPIQHDARLFIQFDLDGCPDMFPPDEMRYSFIHSHRRRSTALSSIPYFCGAVLSNTVR